MAAFPRLRIELPRLRAGAQAMLWRVNEDLKDSLLSAFHFPGREHGAINRFRGIALRDRRRRIPSEAGNR